MGADSGPYIDSANPLVFGGAAGGRGREWLTIFITPPPTTKIVGSEGRQCVDVTIIV